MAYPVARYLSIDSTDAPTFTVGGDVAFLADTTGTPQVWRLSEPAAWPDRLTAHDERVSFVDASPTREELVFGMDEGSNERDQLYRYDLETGRETALTDRPDAIHLWGGWSPDGDQIAFAANRRESDTFDVYVRDRTGGGTASDGAENAEGADDVEDAGGAVPEAELVWEGPGGFVGVAAWHPDGDALVLEQANSSADQVLYWLDLESGEAERISDADEEARYSHVQFGPDAGLYAVTDHGENTAYVGRIMAGRDADAAAGTVEPVERGGERWNVDGLAIDADTGRVAYTRNVDGYSDLRVGTIADDGASVAEAVEPEIPEGVVSDLTLSPDGDRVGFTFAADDRPYSVYVVDCEALRASNASSAEQSSADSRAAKPRDDGKRTDPRAADDGAVERWIAPGTLGIPEERLLRSETVRYETFDGREIPAYWTLPEGVDSEARSASDATGERSDSGAPNPDERVPVIVDIHGGPEHQRRPWFYPTKQYFLDRGYAVLEPNVRGSSGYGKAYTHLDDREKRMDSVRDIEYAVDWLREQEAVDDDRIVAYGRSYGGFMVLAAITEYPDLWAAAVDFVGIADFETFLENTGEWRRSHRAAEYGSLDDPELLERISPIHRVDRIECPLFIQHGANDPRVPVGEAEQIAEAVRERGVPVETLVFEDEGHHTTDRANLIEEFERIAAFLDEHV